MDEQHAPFFNQSGKFADVLHPAKAGVGSIAPTFDLRTGPKDGLFGCHIESLGVKQRAAIVVPQDTHRKPHDMVQTLAGVWTVPDHVPQADNAIDLLAIDVLHDRFERGQVSMNVANDRCLRHKFQFIRSKMRELLTPMLQSIP
jgi:hypothetical protein